MVKISKPVISIIKLKYFYKKWIKIIFEVQFSIILILNNKIKNKI